MTTYFNNDFYGVISLKSQSIIIGLGDYSEGYLCIEDELTKKVTKHSTFHKIIKFNGSKNKHWTAPFSGQRFTLIFYNNTRF